jgi:hypothetical protein
MKKSKLFVSFTLLFTLFTFISCETGNEPDTNQLLIEQIKAFTD